jgi:hypothetical protein
MNALPKNAEKKHWEAKEEASDEATITVLKNKAVELKAAEVKKAVEAEARKAADAEVKCITEA